MNQQNNQDVINKKISRKLKNDLIFISSLILILIVLGLCFFIFRSEGDSVTVKINGEHFATYSLNENRTVEIRTGENKENLNVLVIEDGKAFVKSATCPDGICAAHKPISFNGESISCRPYGISIVIKSTQNNNNVPDIIT